MTILPNQTRSLEDAFFLEQDRVLKEQFKKMQQMKETKEALAEVSGIKNDKILQKLVELDIRPDVLAALAVVPLIEVAWADGEVDNKEREVVMTQLSKAGIGAGSTEFSLIEQWLTHKPGKKLMDAWVGYVHGLCESLTSEERRMLKDELLHNVRTVAAASGGLFGLGSRVSQNEAKVIAELEGAFPA